MPLLFRLSLPLFVGKLFVGFPSLLGLLFAEVEQLVGKVGINLFKAGVAVFAEQEIFIVFGRLFGVQNERILALLGQIGIVSIA